jgi:hypothetical protein
MAQRLSLEEGMAALVQIERTHPVTEWEVDGVRIWPFARVRIGYGINAAALHLPYAPSDRVGPVASTALRRAVAAAPLARQALRRTGSRRHDAVFLSNGISLTRFDAVSYERFCDPIRDEMAAAGRTSLLLMPSSSPGPFCEPALPIQPQLDWAKVRGVAMASLRSLSLPGYDDVVHEVRRVHPGLDAFVPSRRFLRLGLSTLLSMHRFFGRLLDRVQPKAGFVDNYYKIDAMAFVLACRTAGIPSVDIQHGMQGAMHPAYGQWSAVPDSGYALLPRYFWVWSEEEKGHIDSWRPDGDHEPIVGGNPFLRMCLRGADPRLAAARRAIDRLRVALPSGRTVLLTLNGFESPEQLEALAAIVAAAPVTWRWWIRSHPRHLEGAREAGEILARRGIDTAEVEGVSEAPLFLLLPKVDVHVTGSSSVVIDAAAFDVPSVVLAEDGLAKYPRERQAGLVEFAPADEVVRAVERLAETRLRRVPHLEDGGLTWATKILAG